MKLLLALLMCVPAFAQSVQQSLSQLGKTDNYVLAFRWTADGSGNVPVTTGQGLACCFGFLVSAVETVPLSPSPTANYSVSIQDPAGVDILQGAAATLSATAPATFAASGAAPPLQGAFSLVLTGNSVAGAKGVVYVFLLDPKNVVIGGSSGGGGTAGVTSFNTRTGAVVSQTGDYTFSQIGGTKQGNTTVPQMAGTNSGVLGALLCDDANGNATTVGCTGGSTPAAPIFLDSRVYNWTPQTPGGTLSSLTPVAVTVNPCPAGVNAIGSLYHVYISGGTGTAESPLVTATTCPPGGGGSGTISFTPNNGHSGAWTIGPTSCGMSEALQLSGTSALPVQVIGTPGTCTVHARIVIPSNTVFAGSGVGTLIQVAAGEWQNAIRWQEPLLTNAAVVETYPNANNVVIENMVIDENRASQTFITASDLHVDASNNLKVTSVSHSFTNTDVGTQFTVNGGTGCTNGLYAIGSVSTGAAILTTSPGATGSTCSWTTTPYAFTVSLSGATNSIVRNVTVQNPIHNGSGFGAMTAAATDNLFDHVNLIGPGGALGSIGCPGGGFSQGARVTFANSIATSICDDGFVFNSPQATDNVAINNTVTGNSNVAYHAEGSVRTAFINNRCSGGAQACSQNSCPMCSGLNVVQAGMRWIGNYFSGAVQLCIAVRATATFNTSPGAIIQGNVCESNGTGINILGGVTGASIVGNTSRLNSGNGFAVTSDAANIPSGLTITGNVAADNGTVGARQAGFLFQNSTANTPGNNMIFSNNQAFDTRSGTSKTQSYGIFIQPNNGLASWIFANNDLKNNYNNQSVSITGGYGSLANSVIGPNLVDESGFDFRQLAPTILAPNLEGATLYGKEQGVNYTTISDQTGNGYFRIGNNTNPSSLALTNNAMAGWTLSMAAPTDSVILYHTTTGGTVTTPLAMGPNNMGIPACVQSQLASFGTGTWCFCTDCLPIGVGAPLTGTCGHNPSGGGSFAFITGGTSSPICIGN